MIEPDELADVARDLESRGEAYAVATVVWRQAPSSGQLGGRAIVTADGRLHGWIGGACAEPSVIRAAQRLITAGESALLYLGATDDLLLPEGVTAIPMSCQSEGALQIYVEPAKPAVHLVVVGHSPMARVLTELATAVGWRAELMTGPEFTAADVDPRSVVMVATQGHGDEDVVKHAASAMPAYLGLVASHKRGRAVLGYVAEQGIPQHLLDRVSTPVGIDLGPTTHREIAVSILAELVKVRAAGGFAGEQPQRTELPLLETPDAVDPVCHMTVPADDAHFPYEHEGTTYHFCCVGCRDAFAEDPARFLTVTEA
ncbi:XdhC family protein [Nocardioides sp.]|uniref:XdhC family protein n=1 Tax=Nocardioides sp. TaxID=35761 RepID=UPI002ED422FB